MTHKKGEIITIFEDPLTQQKPEGKAELITKTPNYDNELENWMVKFTGEKYMVYRWIKKET